MDNRLYHMLGLLIFCRCINLLYHSFWRAKKFDAESPSVHYIFGWLHLLVEQTFKPNNFSYGKRKGTCFLQCFNILKCIASSCNLDEIFIVVNHALNLHFILWLDVYWCISTVAMMITQQGHCCWSLLLLIRLS
jgi:hypothetical protein